MLITLFRSFCKELNISFDKYRDDCMAVAMQKEQNCPDLIINVYDKCAFACVIRCGMDI